jgi:ribosomal protein L23
MNEIVKFNQVEEKVITIREQKVILDSDVAAIYGVETMHVNQAVKNNPDKFSDGYIIGLTDSEKKEVIKIFDNPKVKFSPTLPNAFTKKGLYMLATILKSSQATDATIAIVEVFEKISELSQTVADLIQSPDDVQKQALVMQKTGEVLSNIVEKELKTTGTETTFELNLLSTLKIKHTIKREAKK